MDNTLDTIRASTEATMQEEVSYLYGRDPSILAFGQQRFISKESQKNLYSLYEEEESNDGIISESLSSQTIKVYLRMKPFSRRVKYTKEQEEAYTIDNSTTLFTKMSNLDYNTSCLRRPKSSDTVCKKYTFTQTFGPETTQCELFDQVIRPQMVDFLAGQNATVMTYGTTNSGKSYTLQGTTASPGIIPRALEFIFANINTKSTPYYKPVNHSDVIALDDRTRVIELDFKTNLLTFGSTDKIQYTNAYKEMQKLLQEESPVRPSQNTEGFYSVWISFAEIYNETIFDLLSNDLQTRRPSLKLSTDSQGRTFIKGLKTVCVNSGSEAYQILMTGQYNLKVAATALNARSSRSHCIFTVTLLKYFKENCPQSAEVSTFAFCDLAGSERLKKTLNEGERLKEAQNINTSLLVLGRCLKSIYETQGSKQKSQLIGPFRESKLTRLFQRALSGNENIALIVNVNPIPNLYVETQNVLNFSAIAKKIVIEPKKISRKKSTSRFSKIVAQSIKTVTDWDTMEFENTDDTETESDQEVDMVHPEDYEELLDENKQLKQEILNLKNSYMEREMQTRQELADTYTETIKKIELEWRNRVKVVEDQHEDDLEYALSRMETFYKQQINQLESRKRMRTENEDIDEEDALDYEELEAEVVNLQSKIDKLKETNRNLREQNEKELTEKNKVIFELSVTKDELKNVKSLLKSAEASSEKESHEHLIQELKDQLNARNEKNKQLKIMLNEAKEEYIAITNDGRHMEEKLKSNEEMLLQFEDKIMDLEVQLNYANDCLSEKVKTVEILEDKIDRQNKLIAEFKEDNLNLKEKMRLQKDIMRSKKETVACEESSVKRDEPVTNVRDESCQTLVPDVANCEIQTENVESTEYSESIKIKKEPADTISVEEKCLQTSFLDISNKQRMEELEGLKKMFDKLEIETHSKETEYEKKIEELKDTIKMEYENKVKELEDAVKESQKEHELTKEHMKTAIEILKEKDDFKSQFLEEFKSKAEELEDALKESQKEHELTKEHMKTAIEILKEKDDFKSQFLEEFKSKSEELEEELKKQTIEMNNILKECVSEKAELETTLKNSENKCRNLEGQLEKALKDRDTEIKSLQKEVKELIQSQAVYAESRDKENEKQIKMTLKTLTATEETLAKVQENNNQLQKEKEKLTSQLDCFKEKVMRSSFVEEKVRLLENEISVVKEHNKALKYEIEQKQIEFEKFSKHRDETIKKYEDLVNNLQGDAEREMKEKTRLQDLFQKQQTPTPSKDEVRTLKTQLKEAHDLIRVLEEDKFKEKKSQSQKTRRTRRRDKENYENTSDDEASYSDRKKRSPRQPKPSPATTTEGSIIEISSTESKRQTRLRPPLGPPDIQPISEKKKTSNRRRKLFQQENEGFIDLEPCEVQPLPPPSPLSSCRNLRTRKK